MPTENGNPVDVEHATDQQFQRFVDLAELGVEKTDILEWSFDDRCGIINHALKHGLSLPFVEPQNNSETIQYQELFESDEVASDESRAGSEESEQ